ncbi:uncharacterized protein BJX67DRAFT_391220 [Aspergillus lucknowensis]|uniref:Zn(2)-C6 fungal-type domain-containing protein n=1 Tax=Aspergillus lucknowensis TaxID=176173 RepID=A0ABR4LG56_9EURO
MSDLQRVPPALTNHGKRRRVRKGTHSCWECKRRKIRCLFADPGNATCISCQHRRIPCVSQEIPEDLSAARRGNRQLADRVARIEDAMKDWLARSHAPYDSTQANPNLTPAEVALQHLLAALPAPRDAQILLREGARPSLYAELTNSQPRRRLIPETLAVPPSPPEFPPRNRHPVLLAKQMLLFAITLQSPCGDEVLGLSESPTILMHRLHSAATTWVTTRHEMHNTADSLICIILEGVFETNAGNLRRAWAVYRRALTVAQLMGLHCCPRPRLPCIDPQLDTDPECLWFRIVYMDRYLSLLLGLPQGTTDQTMTDPAILRHETPLGQYERHLTVIASRTIERNQSRVNISEDATTHALDAELLSVAQSMPPAFWRAPNFHALTPGSPEALVETLRLGAQIYYHSLLIHLHLPYMLQRREHNDNNNIKSQVYSKNTCISSSREIITRFIAHRSFNPMSSCSRPVDFFALVAAMTLLLAHIDAHPSHQAREMVNSLSHQRPTDRAMLDQALEQMDLLAHLNNDDASRQSAALIRRLLDIEADAAKGNRYTVRNVSITVDVSGDGNGSSHSPAEKKQSRGEDDDSKLCLEIPHLGIRIARQRCVSREPGIDNGDYLLEYVAVSGDEPSMRQNSEPTLNPRDLHLQVQEASNELALQGVDMAFFDSLMRGTPCIDRAG